MSMDVKQTKQAQPLIPFQGSYRQGLQAGSWINSFSLVTYVVMWFVPTTRVNFHTAFGGLGLLYNTAKDWFGVYRTRVQMLPMSELESKEGLVDLQYHLKAKSDASDGIEKVLTRTEESLERNNKALQQRINGMEVATDEDVFMLEADDPSDKLFGRLNNQLQTRTHLRSQLAYQEFRSKIKTKLEQVIGTFMGLQTELGISFDVNSPTSKDQLISDSFIPPQWNTLISYVQGFQTAIQGQSQKIQEANEQLRAKEAEVKRLQGELDALQKTAERLQKSNAQSEETKLQLAEELSQTKESLKEKSVAANKAEESLKALQENLEQANNANATAQKELKELRSSVAAKDALLESTTKEANTKREALGKAEAELASLRTKLEEKEKTLALTEKNLRENQEQLRKVQKELSDAKVRVSALLEAVPEAKSQQETFDKSTQALRSQLTESEAQSSEAKETLLKAKAEFTKKESEAKTQTEALQKKIAEQKSKLALQMEEFETQKRSMEEKLKGHERTAESLKAELKTTEARVKAAQESLQTTKEEFSKKETEAQKTVQTQTSALKQVIDTQKETIEQHKKELETARAETEKLRLQNIKVQQAIETAKTSHKKEILEKDKEIQVQTDRGNKYKEALAKLTLSTQGKLASIEEVTASATTKERRLGAQVQKLEIEIAGLKIKAQESGKTHQEKLSQYHLQLGVILKASNDAARAMREGKGADAITILKEPKDVDDPFYPVIHSLNSLIHIINGSNEPDYGSGLSSAEGTPEKKKSIKYMNNRVRMLRSKSITSAPSSPGSSFGSPNASFASDTDD